MKTKENGEEASRVDLPTVLEREKPLESGNEPKLPR